MSTISKSDLKVIFSRIIDKLEYENIDQVELDTNFYWVIPAASWASFNQPHAHLGSLKDDIDSLILLVNDSERPCTYVDFDRTSAVLKAISEENNPA